MTATTKEPSGAAAAADEKEQLNLSKFRSSLDGSTDAYNSILESFDSTTKQKEFDRLKRQYLMVEPVVEQWINQFGKQEEPQEQDADDDVVWLDLGCGPGHDTSLLCKILDSMDLPSKKKKVIGMDINNDLLDNARSSYQDAYPNNMLSFQCGSSLEIPLKDASVDRIYIKFVLQHIHGEFRSKVLSELFRVLRPGGKVWIIDVDEQTGFHVHPQVQGLQEASELYIDWVGSRPNSNDRTVARKLPALLRQHRFARVRMRSDNVVGGRDEAFSVDDVLQVFYNWKFMFLINDFKERGDSEQESKMQGWFENAQSLIGNPDAFLMYPVFLVLAEKD